MNFWERNFLFNEFRIRNESFRRIKKISRLANQSDIKWDFCVTKYARNLAKRFRLKRAKHAKTPHL